MKRTVILLVNMFVVLYIDAQQWLIEYPQKECEDVVFLAGDMSGNYNYALGYRYDKCHDILYPHALCVDLEGDYVSGEIDRDVVEGSFNSAIGIGDNNIFVTAYCTDKVGSGIYEKMWIAVMNPDLNVLCENYVMVEKPYMSFGYTAHVVINGNNEFVVLVKVAENVTDGIMSNCDFVFYKFDSQCNLLSSNCLENTSYNSDISDFVFIPDLDCYAVFGRAMNVTGVSSVFYVDENFNLISCMPIDNHDNYQNYIRPYFISVGHLYEDNSMLMSMQTGNTVTQAEYCPLVLRVDTNMNILDSIMFERCGVTDYVSQYNSMVYVDSNTIYVSSFEVRDMFCTIPNEALVYLINDDMDLIGKKIFKFGCFMNVLYIQPVADGGCIVQAYCERGTDKVAVLCKLNVDDFRDNDDIVIDEYREELAVEVYPNPVSSVLNINIETLKSKDIRVKIYDISGRRCLEEQSVIESGVVTLDLSSLNKGMYCCWITDGDGNFMTETFIKE